MPAAFVNMAVLANLTKLKKKTKTINKMGAIERKW